MPALVRTIEPSGKTAQRNFVGACLLLARDRMGHPLGLIFHLATGGYLGLTPPCLLVGRSDMPNRTHAPSLLQNIRLGSAAANPLSRSRNQRADGDGCVGSHLDAAAGSRV